MKKLNRYIASALTAFALFLTGCSQEPEPSLSGIWRSEEDLGAKNLVLEFEPGGTGKVFSGSLIGMPPDAMLTWERNDDLVRLATAGEDPIVAEMKILSLDETTLQAMVNENEFTFVRAGDAAEAAPEVLP